MKLLTFLILEIPRSSIRSSKTYTERKYCWFFLNQIRRNNEFRVITVFIIENMKVHSSRNIITLILFSRYSSNRHVDKQYFWERYNFPFSSIILMSIHTQHKQGLLLDDDLPRNFSPRRRDIFGGLMRVIGLEGGKGRAHRVDTDMSRRIYTYYLGKVQRSSRQAGN